MREYKTRLVVAILMYLLWYALPHISTTTLAEFCVEELSCPVIIVVLMWKVLVNGPRLAKLSSIAVALPAVFVLVSMVWSSGALSWL